jgi:hypothetical protein
LCRPGIFAAVIGLCNWCGLAIVGFATGNFGPYFKWFSPLIAISAAYVADRLKHATRGQCALCKRTDTFGLFFCCPRCGLAVCEHECWSFEHLRCRLCLDPYFTVAIASSVCQMVRKMPCARAQIAGGLNASPVGIWQTANASAAVGLHQTCRLR